MRKSHLPPDILESLGSLDETQLRLLACACAEHVLPIFEAQAPDDSRPRRAIETARRFAAGAASLEALHAARSDAEGAAYDVAFRTPEKGASPEQEAAAPAAACAEGCCIVSARQAAEGTLETAIEVVETVAVGVEDASVLWGRGSAGFALLDAATASALRAAHDALWAWQRSAIERLQTARERS